MKWIVGNPAQQVFLQAAVDAAIRQVVLDPIRILLIPFAVVGPHEQAVLFPLEGDLSHGVVRERFVGRLLGDGIHVENLGPHRATGLRPASFDGFHVEAIVVFVVLLELELGQQAKLAAQWLQGVERFLLAGETILVNVNGGTMPLDGTTILVTAESDDIDWNVQYDDEIITISRWPEGKHYYLCSSKYRIFVPDKHSTFEAARKAALRHVSANRIKSRC